MDGDDVRPTRSLRWRLHADHPLRRYVIRFHRASVSQLTRSARQVARAARHPSTHRGRRLLGVLAVAAVGVVLGLLVGGHVTGNVGPFRAEFALSPSLSGGTRVAIPPLGALQLDTH